MDCDSIRRAIETRNFVGWQGFSDSCKPSELFDSLPSDFSDRPTRPLGSSFQPAAFVLLQLPGYYRPMANFRQGKLVLFDGMNPELNWLALADDLGKPAAELDWYYGTLAMPGGEWVYPQRGITIFLNTNRDKALHVALYHPSTLENYLGTLRPHLRKTNHPKTIND